MDYSLLLAAYNVDEIKNKNREGPEGRSSALPVAADGEAQPQPSTSNPQSTSSSAPGMHIPASSLHTHWYLAKSVKFLDRFSFGIANLKPDWNWNILSVCKMEGPLKQNPSGTCSTESRLRVKFKYSLAQIHYFNHNVCY